MKFRSRYIPKESVEVRHPQDLGIAYVYRVPNRGYCVIAYGGKRTHSDFHYSYKTIEAAHEKIETWFSNLQAHVEAVQKRRTESFAPHAFKIGDIVTNSWGYDQTNVDWYRVVRTSRSFVWLQPICCETEETGFMSGQSAPDIDTSSDDPSQWGFKPAKGEITQHKASGTYVSMRHGCGSKWDGQKRYTSWYA